MKNALAVLFLLLAAACCAGVQRVPQETIAVADMLFSTVAVESTINGHEVISDPVTGAWVEGPKVDIGRIGSGVVYWKTFGLWEDHGTWRVGIKSKILTAQHVLEAPNPGEVVDGTGPYENKKIRIDSVSFVVRTRSGAICGLKPLTRGDNASGDVATALVDCDAGQIADIAIQLPPVGSRIYISGHPTGVRPAVVTEGFLSGRSSAGFIVTSAPVLGGSSGGAIWYNGQVISILVRVNTAFHHVSYGVPLAVVQLRILGFSANEPPEF